LVSRDEAATRIELLRDILMHESIELMFSSLDQSVQRCLRSADSTKKTTMQST